MISTAGLPENCDQDETLADKSVGNVNQIQVRFQALGGGEGNDVGHFAFAGVEPYFSVELPGMIQKYLPSRKIPTAQQHTVAQYILGAFF